MVRIVNIGNTCYINSILQILFHSDIVHKNQYFTKDFKEYKKLFLKLVEIAQKSDDKELFNPKQLLSYLKWNENFQFGLPHDSHEAFLHILDKTDISDFKGEIIDIMYTQSKPIEQFIKCDIFHSLEIPVTNSDFKKCLTDFFKIDSITDWKDKQGVKRELIKSSLLHKIPKNICFVLRQPYINKKKVNYPFQINLESICTINSHSNQYEYSLYGVIIHTGSHYYTYIFQNNKWFKYDDDVTNEVYFQIVLNDAPYMLFYSQI